MDRRTLSCTNCSHPRSTHPRLISCGNMQSSGQHRRHPIPGCHSWRDFQGPFEDERVPKGGTCPGSHRAEPDLEPASLSPSPVPPLQGAALQLSPCTPPALPCSALPCSGLLLPSTTVWSAGSKQFWGLTSSYCPGRGNSSTQQLWQRRGAS